MADVFISYSSKDKYFAELLAKHLDESSVSVWRDTSSLLAGDDWRQAIDIGIDEAALCILALSQASCSSHYVTYEWATAMAKNKTILPILLEDCSRHPKIEPIQYIDFKSHQSESWQKIVQRVQETLKEQADFRVSTDESDGPSKTGVDDQSPEDRRLENDIIAYLNDRGFRMMSFERIQKKFGGEHTDDRLEKLAIESRSLQLATLKGFKPGLKLL